MADVAKRWDSTIAKSGQQLASTAGSGMQVRVDERYAPPIQPGDVVGGKYEIVGLIGEGGVGFVVAASRVELGDKVALKFLRPEMLNFPDVVARFKCEGAASVKIKNEHVARVFDVGQLPAGMPYIVMELLEGRDLFDVITQDGPLTVKCAIDYVLQACEALADAHSCGIVHRDIKPENLFLVERSPGIHLIKVLDFGISKVALTETILKTMVPLTRTAIALGSPVYMSPEQIRAPQSVDLRTDIWSMGCVLHELVTGSPAFDAPSITQLSAAILEVDPAGPSHARSHVPPALDMVVARCLAKDPAQRYQSIAELALALYPLAANRSRVSVEHCCLLLNVNPALAAEIALSRDQLGSGLDMRETNSSLVEAPPGRGTIESQTNAERDTRKGYSLSKLLIVSVALGLVLALCLAFWTTARGPARRAAVKSVAAPVLLAPATLLPPPVVALSANPRNEPAPQVVSAPPTSTTATNALTLRSGAITATSVPNAKAAQPRMVPKSSSAATPGKKSISVGEPDPGF